jgi:hypothetical protein
MRESRTYGSVRGALSNERPYRDRPTLGALRVSVAAFFDGPLSKDFDGLPTSASRAL